MSRLSQRKGHSKAQGLLLSSMARDQKGDPRGFQKAGAKSEGFKERVELAKRYVSSRILSVKANGTEGIPV